MHDKWQPIPTRDYRGLDSITGQPPSLSGRPSSHRVIKTPAPGKNIRCNPEYEFLRHYVISPATLDDATYLAFQWDSQIHEVLISLGWISEATYCRALATHLNIDFLPDDPQTCPLLPTQKTPLSILPEPALGLLLQNGALVIVLNGRTVSPSKLAEIIAVHRSGGDRIAVTTQTAMRAAERAQNGHSKLDRATNHLANTAPALSASSGLWPSQALTIAMLLGMLAGAFAMAPRLTLIFIMALLTLPFLIIVILRLATILVITIKNPEKSGKKPADDPPPPTDAELPLYSILVPLYNEHEILP